MPETPSDPLLAYLRENGGRYSLEALRQHLVTQGYDAGRIRAALDAYRRESGAGQPAMFSAFSAGSAGAGRYRPGGLATVAVAISVITGIGLLVLGTCAGVVGFSALAKFRDPSIVVAFLVIAAVLALAVAMIHLPIRWYRRQSAAPSPPSDEPRP